MHHEWVYNQIFSIPMHHEWVYNQIVSIALAYNGYGLA